MRSVTFAVNVLLLTLIRMSWRQAMPALGFGVWMLSLGLRDLSELLNCATPIFLPQQAVRRTPLSAPQRNAGSAVAAAATAATAATLPSPQQQGDGTDGIPLVAAAPTCDSEQHSALRRNSTTPSEWIAIALGAKKLMASDEGNNGCNAGARMAEVVGQAMNLTRAATAPSEQSSASEPADGDTLRRRHQRQPQA